MLPTAATRNPQRRLALCIGNSAYQNSYRPLECARRDAADMADFLGTHAGFDVVMCGDQTRAQMWEAILRLMDERAALPEANTADISPAAPAANLTILLYCGHAVSTSSGSIILGVDCPENLERNLAWKTYGIDVNDIMHLAASTDSGPLVVILDACRQVHTGIPTAPAPSMGGITQDSLFVYSCSLDEPANDEPSYTRTLLEVLYQVRQAEPGRSILDVISQANMQHRRKTGSSPQMAARSLEIFQRLCWMPPVSQTAPQWIDGVASLPSAAPAQGALTAAPPAAAAAQGPPAADVAAAAAVLAAEQAVSSGAVDVDQPSATVGGDPGSEQITDDKGQHQLCGAHNDVATMKDSLSVSSAARGAAGFLLHPDTAATTLAVYGRWGSGKSTFMKLVEREMLIEVARAQVDAMEPRTAAALKESPNITVFGLHKDYKDLRDKVAEQGASTSKELESLMVLASPRLMTVSFNAWQYLNEEQVWGGLIVEITQRLEEKLARKQRNRMKFWWRTWWMKVILTFWWAQWIIAWRYNWSTRRNTVVLHLVLPVAVMVAMILTLTIWGSSQLREMAQQGGSDSKNYSFAAAVTTVVGAISAVALVLERASAVLKQVSDVLLEGRNFFTLKDHSEKIGYQHAVIKDLQKLKALLGKQMEWLAVHRRERAPADPPAADSDTTSAGKHSIRVVVFIDDLDRCRPSKVVEVLEAAHMVLANSGFSVVIGMDKSFICSAINLAYKDLLIDVASAEDFLRKIVQVELTLPPPASKDLRKYITSMGMNVEVVVDPGSNEHSGQRPGSAATVAPASPPAVAPTAAPAGGLPAEPSAEVRTNTQQQPEGGARPIAGGAAASAGLPASGILPSHSSPVQHRRLVSLGTWVYTTTVRSVLRCILDDHDDQLFANSTPRDIKRLLNHYMLATHIILEREMESQQGGYGAQPEFDSEQERQLLAWCLLWWRYPRGMRLAVPLLDRKPKPQSLKELVIKAHSCYQNWMDSAGAQTTAPAATAATPAAAITMLLLLAGKGLAERQPQDSGKPDKDKDEEKKLRLKAAVGEIRKIKAMLLCDTWCLSAPGEACDKKKLWEISGTAMHEYRLFGMDLSIGDDDTVLNIQPTASALQAVATTAAGVAAGEDTATDPAANSGHGDI